MDLPFRTILIVVSIVQALLSASHLRHSGANSTKLRGREEGPLLAAATGLAVTALAISSLLYFVCPAWVAWSAMPLPVWLRWAGVAPLLGGGWFWVWGLRSLGANLTVDISTRSDQQLITSGAYAWVRHPLYSGGMFEFIGFSLVAANGCIFIAALGYWTLVAIRTPLEERKLIDQFGDEYLDYVQRVGRFLPSLGR